jgi:Tfp pilus assembly protein PilX
MFLQELIKRKKGSAIVIAMSVMVVISFTAISSANYLNQQIRISRSSSHSAPAYYVAESGIECMLYELVLVGSNRNVAETNCEVNKTVGAGFYEISQSQQGQIITIVSVGSFENTHRSIEIKLEEP